MTMTTVLVTGVRGNTGRIVAPLLRARGAVVRGGSRAAEPRQDGVEPVRFDWEDPATWTAAVAGVDAIYLQRPEVERAPELIGRLLDVAGAGPRVVLLSDNIHGDAVPRDSWEGRVERAVTERARRWTLLRPSWFQQVFGDPRYFRDAIRDDGEIEIPTGGARISFVDARDVAEVAVAALLDEGHDGRAYALTGPDASSLADVAARLSAVAGHAVRHRDTPLADAVAAFAAGDGVDPWYVDYIDHVWALMRSGTGARVSDDVERVLGRPARTLADYVDEHAAAWRRGGVGAGAVMRKWSVTRFGADLGGLELLEVEEPGPPAADELLVEVRAAGLSISDLLLATGGMPGMDRSLLPHPIGIEYAGAVRERGADVTDVPVGARVVGFVDGSVGAAGQLLRVPARDVAPLPDALSFEEGAALPIAFMTAHVVLHRQGALRPGHRVLITAAASGTGLALVQLATAAGAVVHGAVAGPAKHDAVRAAGAVEVFDHTLPGWERELSGLDLVVDTIGGESIARSFDLLGPGGRLFVLDATSRHPRDGESDYRREPGDRRFDPITDLMFAAKSVTGIFVPLLWEREGGPGRLLRESLEHVGDGAIRPVIARSFAFEDAVEALRYLQQRRNAGRVVLRL